MKSICFRVKFKMVVCNDAIAACDILMEEMFNGTNLDVQVQDDIHAQNIYDLKCLIDKCVLYGKTHSSDLWLYGLILTSSFYL